MLRFMLEIRDQTQVGFKKGLKLLQVYVITSHALIPTLFQLHSVNEWGRWEYIDFAAKLILIERSIVFKLRRYQGSVLRELPYKLDTNAIHFRYNISE